MRKEPLPWGSLSLFCGVVIRIHKAPLPHVSSFIHKWDYSLLILINSFLHHPLGIYLHLSYVSLFPFPLQPLSVPGSWCISSTSQHQFTVSHRPAMSSLSGFSEEESLPWLGDVEGPGSGGPSCSVLPVTSLADNRLLTPVGGSLSLLLLFP